MAVKNELSEFERERQERVQRNRARLEALEIPSLHLTPAPRPQRTSVRQGGGGDGDGFLCCSDQGGCVLMYWWMSAGHLDMDRFRPSYSPQGTVARAAKRRALAPEAPMRRSARVAGIDADGNQILNEDRGKIVAGIPLVKPEPKERHPSADVGLEAMDSVSKREAHYARALGGAPGSGGEDEERSGPPHAKSLSWLKKCELDEADVVKVLPGAISHLAFHPTTATRLLAVGDKYGNIALWHHDAAMSDQLQKGARGGACLRVRPVLCKRVVNRRAR